FKDWPCQMESTGRRFEISRHHLGVSQPIAGFREKSVSPAFLGARHTLGSDRFRSPHVRTHLLYEEHTEKCPPAFSPVDPRSLTTGACALDRMLDPRRSEALRISESAIGRVAQV